MVPKVLPEMETLKAKLERGAREVFACTMGDAVARCGRGHTNKDRRLL